MAIPIYRNHSDREHASADVVEPFSGGGGNRTREPFPSLVPPSEKAAHLFETGRVAEAAQQWHIEELAYTLGMNEQQVVRQYGKPELPKPPPSVVYLLCDRKQPPDGYPVKVGYTRNLRRRMEELQAGSIDKLLLLHCIPGGKHLEQKIHDASFEYQIRGDWFEMCDAIREAFLTDGASLTAAGASR